MDIANGMDLQLHAFRVSMMLYHSGYYISIFHLMGFGAIMYLLETNGGGDRRSLVYCLILCGTEQSNSFQSSPTTFRPWIIRGLYLMMTFT